MPSYFGTKRLEGLPDSLRHRLVEIRRERGWTQAALGRAVGLPQVHISGIETGKVVPRFNTLLDLVRVLEYDLLLVPRPLVPAVESLTRDYRRSVPGNDSGDGESPLYATNDDTEDVP